MYVQNAMSKNAVKKSKSKGSFVHKKTSEYVAKGQGAQCVIRERSAGSGRFVEESHRPAVRGKVSEYTIEEAEWLNSLVHSAAKGALSNLHISHAS